MQFRGERKKLTNFREGSEFMGWGGGGLYVSASKKPRPPAGDQKKPGHSLPEAKKIQPPLHDFTIEK